MLSLLMCHLAVICCGNAGGSNGTPISPMVTEEAQRMLHDATELDYLTHIIIRMYENKRYAEQSRPCCVA